MLLCHDWAVDGPRARAKLSAGVSRNPIHPRSNQHTNPHRRNMSGGIVRYLGCELRKFDLAVAFGIMFFAVKGESPRLNQGQNGTRG